MKKFGFSGHERLKNTIDYNHALKKGEKVVHPFFYLYYIKNNLLYSRLGIRIGKKFGDAHARNRVKRIIKEVYRINKSFIKGFDLVFIPRFGAKYVFSDVNNAIKQVFLKVEEGAKKYNI
ncbi:MAG: ribonuclease P protein component [bacterium]|nr:ribonuclease P protein component [bacterium]